MSGRLLRPFLSHTRFCISWRDKNPVLNGRVTVEQKKNVARYEIISHLLNVPFLWDVMLFHLGEYFPTFRKIVIPLFQGQIFQEGAKTIVLNV